MVVGLKFSSESLAIHLQWNVGTGVPMPTYAIRVVWKSIRQAINMILYLFFIE